MEIQREPVALRDDRELARLLVQAGVRDRDRGVRGEQLDQLLVLVGEVCGADLLRQIEGADDARRRDDRHAEERAHVRMPLRPPATETWVLVDVAGAVGLLRREHGAEDAVLPWQRAEGGDQLVAHARGEEGAEAAVAVGKPERGVAGLGELAGAVDEPLQDVVDRQLGRDREDGVADRFQRRVQSLRHERTIVLEA